LSKAYTPLSRFIQGNTQTGSQPARDRYLIASEYLRAVAARSGALYLRAESIDIHQFGEFHRSLPERTHLVGSEAARRSAHSARRLLETAAILLGIVSSAEPWRRQKELAIAR